MSTLTEEEQNILLLERTNTFLLGFVDTSKITETLNPDEWVFVLGNKYFKMYSNDLLMTEYNLNTSDIDDEAFHYVNNYFGEKSYINHEDRILVNDLIDYIFTEMPRELLNNSRFIIKIE